VGTAIQRGKHAIFAPRCSLLAGCGNTFAEAMWFNPAQDFFASIWRINKKAAKSSTFRQVAR
jgi:hypothetical protein